MQQPHIDRIGPFSSAQTVPLVESLPNDGHSPELPEHDHVAAFALIADCEKRLDAMATTMRRLKASGQCRRAKSLGRTVLSQRPAMIAALAYSAQRQEIIELTEQPRKLIGLAAKLDMWADSGEPTFWRVINDRYNGKERLIYQFGVREYARQYLARRIAAPLIDLHPRQFILQGGMAALVQWLNKSVPAAKVVVTTDVPSCFYALNRERVEVDMPLPRRVTKSVLIDPMVRATQRALSMRRGCQSTLSPSSYGCGAYSMWAIPQGSALAALAAEAVLCPVLEAVENKVKGVLVASYGDNLIILASSVEAAYASIDALLAAASGRIRPQAVEGLCTRIRSDAPADGFVFVGSRFTLTDGVLERRRPEGFELRFLVRFAELVIDRKIDKLSAKRRLDGWLQSNSFEPDAHLMAAQFRAHFGLTD